MDGRREPALAREIDVWSCQLELKDRRRKMVTRDGEKYSPYDPWHAKVAFGVFLCVLAGSLIALYSGVSNPALMRLLDALS